MQKNPPLFPPFDGCKPTLPQATLLFRTPLLILLPIHAVAEKDESFGRRDGGATKGGF